MVNFSILAPEINSALIYAGAGSAPMLEASAAWDGLATELGSAASSFSSVTSGLADQAWQGAASVAMAAAAAPYATFLNAAAAHAQGAAEQARTVVSAFEGTRATMVHPLAVLLNRNATVRMALSNWFGLHTPLIAQLECDYERMWAQDVAAMAGYHGQVSAAATQLASWQASLPSLGQATSAAAAAAGLPFDVGFGNKGGTGNIGSGNTGDNNLGSGNIGGGNVGSGNTGSSNVGSGNTGDSNVGAGNIGKRQHRLRKRQFQPRSRP